MTVSWLYFSYSMMCVNVCMSHVTVCELRIVLRQKQINQEIEFVICDFMLFSVYIHAVDRCSQN